MGGMNLLLLLLVVVLATAATALSSPPQPAAPLGIVVDNASALAATAAMR